MAKEKSYLVRVWMCPDEYKNVTAGNPEEAEDKVIHHEFADSYEDIAHMDVFVHCDHCGYANNLNNQACEDCGDTL
jgi:hypothetical protein